MTSTVDLVVVGATPRAVDRAIDGARRGQRVVLVDRSRSAAHSREVRRRIRSAGNDVHPRVTVRMGTEVLCVDGLARVEVVLVRHIRTGRVTAFNASSLIVCDP